MAYCQPSLLGFPLDVSGQLRENMPVRDYGKGFPANPEGKMMPAIGIGGMRERPRQLGGELAIRKAEPATSLEAGFPCE